MKKIIPFSKEIIFKTNLAEITSISLEHTLNTQDKDIDGSFIISGDYKISDTSINTESFSYDLPFHITMDDKYVLDNIILDIDDFYYEIVNNNILSIHIDVLIDKLEEILIEDLVKNDEVEKEIEYIDSIEESLDSDRKEIEEETSNDEILIERKEDLNQMESDKFEEFLESLNEESLDNEKKDDEKIEENNIVTTLKEEVEESKEEIKEKRCIEDEGLFSNLNVYSETYKSYKIYIVRDGDSVESILEKYSISKDKLQEYNDLKELKIGDKIIIPT